MRSGIPYFFCGMKECLVQLLNYSSVLVQNLDFSLIGQETKLRYLELSHDWLPAWECDFQSKKSCKLMNYIMASDKASKESEFLSALNVSLKFFSQSFQR